MQNVVGEFPWWRALTTAELASMELPDSRQAQRGVQLRDLWEQTQVWNEGPDLVADIFDISQSQLEVILDTLETILDDAYCSAEIPEWENQRRRWLELSSTAETNPLPSTLPFRSLVHGASIALSESLTNFDLDSGSPRDNLVLNIAQSLRHEPPTDEIENLTTRALIQELHTFSKRSDDVTDFQTLLRQAGFEKHLSHTYPVLTRLVVTRLGFWVARTIEFLDRLHSDLPVLEASGFLNFNDSTVLNDHGTSAFQQVSVKTSAGDSHNAGRSVIIVLSPYGNVVYKPRGAANEQALQRLRDDIFGDLKNWSFNLPAVINQSDWCWQQYIEDQTLNTSDELERGAYSLGGLAAVIQLLGGTDFHHENVIFHEGRACPVDLETVLRVDPRQANQPLEENADPAFRALMDSVAVAGIVPGKIISRSPDGNVDATDVSVVGFKPGQRTPITVATIESDEQGLPHIVERLIDDESSGGQPELKKYGTEFLEGFLDGMHRLGEVVAEKSPQYLIDLFEQGEFRYIPRPTMVYAKLLSESYHPFFLQHGAMRDVVLAKAWSGYQHAPGRRELLKSEYADLLVGDIPHMVRTISERSLWGPSEYMTIGDRLKARILEQLEPASVAYQQRVIELSFASIGAPLNTVDALNRVETDGSKSQLARALFRRALAGCQEVEGKLAGTTLIAASADHWTVSPLGFETYSGRSGLLLAHQALKMSHDADRHDLLIRSVLPMADIVTACLRGDETAMAALDAGAASSLAGWISCLTAVPELAQYIDTINAANQAVDLLTDLIQHDTTFDLISGSAGAITVGLGIASLVDSAKLRLLLQRASQHLHDHAQSTDHGVGWVDPESKQLLCGYSHGAAGIAVSLLRAAVYLEDADVRALGMAALEYDDSLYDVSVKNWPDLRAGSKQDVSMRAWCHGSPGGILARALVWDQLPLSQQVHYTSIFDDVADAILDDIEQSIVSGGPDMLGDSLCHGRVGNLVILKMLMEAGFLDPWVHQRITETSASVQANLRSSGPVLGGLPGAPIPDLFMGLSGVGWGVARLAHDPAQQEHAWEVLTFGLHIPTMQRPCGTQHEHVVAR